MIGRSELSMLRSIGESPAGILVAALDTSHLQALEVGGYAVILASDDGARAFTTADGQAVLRELVYGSDLEQLELELYEVTR